MVNSSTGTGAAITAATLTNSGLLLPGDFAKLNKIVDFTTSDGNKVLTVNGTGTSASWVTPGTITDITYTPSATQGMVYSSTGADAPILAATTTNAGLLLPADKIILNTIATVVPADATKVLTVNSGGTIAWIAPTPATGGGGAGSQFVYAVNGSNVETTEIFYKGSGDKIIYTKGMSDDGYFCLNIKIPVNTIVDYIRITVTSTADLSSIKNGNYGMVFISITDLANKLNQNVNNMMAPTIAVLGLNTSAPLNPTLLNYYKYNTIGSNINITKCKDGELRLMLLGYPELTATTGFSLILTF